MSRAVRGGRGGQGRAWMGAALLELSAHDGVASAMARVLVDLAALAAIAPIFAPLGCSLGSRTARHACARPRHTTLHVHVHVKGTHKGAAAAQPHARDTRGSHKRDLGARTRARRPRERGRAARGARGGGAHKTARAGESERASERVGDACGDDGNLDRRKIRELL